jgi:hypothetical protein
VAYTPDTKVKIMLDFPAQVVDGGLLSALEISSFNGATPNSDAYLANSSQVQITPVTGARNSCFSLHPVPYSIECR